MWVSSELLDAQFMYCEMAETRSTYKPSTSIHWHVQWNWIVRTSIHWKYNIVQNGTIFRNFYSCILTITSTCTRTSYTLLAYRSAKTLPAQAHQDPEAQENYAEALASSCIFFTNKSTTPPLSIRRQCPAGGNAQQGDHASGCRRQPESGCRWQPGKLMEGRSSWTIDPIPGTCTCTYN